MERTPIVYLLQEPNTDKDLSSAAKQGRIVPIIGAYEKPSQNVGWTINKLAEALKDYDPKYDCICFAGGDPIVEFLAGIVLERLGLDEVIHLLWNREKIDGQKTGSGFYIPRKINLLEGNPENFIKEESNGF